MGIGLVDPILPVLAQQLHASRSQVSLLFTSYLVVTAVAMLVSGWVSSRLGAKRTLIAGLALIVVFSLAATSGTINQIVGFQAGWGLGNALFIATSLAVIVSSSSGGFAGAIVLYETALGLGIAAGPLVGGLLGNISWRGPFFGVAVLMAIALTATSFLLPATPRPAHHSPLSAPLAAPRPGHDGRHRAALQLGLLHLAGLLAVPDEAGRDQARLRVLRLGAAAGRLRGVGAPRLQALFGTSRTLYVNFVLLALDLAVIGFGNGSPVTVTVAVIVAGAFLGVNNTLVTQAVMMVSPVERPVVSASYGFVRFIGGGLAPYAAGKLAERTNVAVPFYVGAGAVLLGLVVFASGRALIDEADRKRAGAGHGAPAAEPVPGDVDARELEGAKGLESLGGGASAGEDVTGDDAELTSH